MKTILISGGNGHIAKQIWSKYNISYEILIPPKELMDITQISQIEEYIFEHLPIHYFIHAAAYTRPMKLHDIYPEISIATNILGTANVVLQCIKYNIKLIYISTDYVYPCIKGDYKEDDDLNPVNSYAWSKLGGECAVRLYENSLIIRTGFCNKPFPHEKAPTDNKKNYMYDEDLSRIIIENLLDQTGIINIGGPAQSAYDFVKKDNPKIIPIEIQNIADVKMGKDCSMNLERQNNLYQ